MASRAFDHHGWNPRRNGEFNQQNDLYGRALDLFSFTKSQMPGRMFAFGITSHIFYSSSAVFMTEQLQPCAKSVTDCY